MITDEQARAVIASMRNAWSGHTPAEVDTLLSWARQELFRRTPPDDGPITAEWCKASGGMSGIRSYSYTWQINSVSVSVWAEDVVSVWVEGRLLSSITTRSQLLALIAALRGEPSENPGQFEPLSPAEQLPNVSRAQMNNIGPSR